VALVEGALTWRDLPGAPPEPLAARLAEPAEGAVLEACPAGEAVAAAIGRALAERGTGAALLIDYGYDDAERRAAGGRDTFQAARRHEYADPLAHPGEADLTAHVDFDALARAARPANAWGAVGQGSFLRALGAEPRAAQLARANPARAEAVAAGLHRLTHPAEMGRLFKAMALTPPNAPPPPGLTAAPRAPEGAG
ncbi:MAG: SAM-dependent methyltransferase, partial [Pseudomonadota bacterium]